MDIRKNLILIAIIFSIVINAQAKTIENPKIQTEYVLSHSPSRTIQNPKIHIEYILGHSPFNRWNFNNKAYVLYAPNTDPETKTSKTSNITLVNVDIENVKKEESCILEITDNKQIIYNISPFSHADPVIIPYFNMTRIDAEDSLSEIALQYLIVDMPTCTFFTAKIPVNYSFVMNYLWSYEDTNIIYNNYQTFSVILPNDGSCGPAAKCKVTFNMKGEKVDGPSAYLMSKVVGKGDYLKVFPVTQNVSYILTIGFSVDGRNVSFGKYLNIFYKAGQSEYLVNEIPINENLIQFVVDVSNNLFGTCTWYHADKKMIHCIQYDVSKNCTMDGGFQYKDDSIPFALYNIAPGSLGLATGICDENDCKKIIFEKVYNNGTSHETTHVEEYDYQRSFAALLRDCKDDNSLCLSLYGANGGLELTRKRYLKSSIL